MPSSLKSLLLGLLPLASGAALSSPPYGGGAPNHIVGSWIQQNATITYANGTKANQWPGGVPSSLLVFTPDLQFIAGFNYADGRPLPIDDLLGGQSNPAAEHGSLMFFGTYTVGGDGQLATEHIVGSTVQESVGLSRNTTVFNITRLDANTLREHLLLGGGTAVTAYYHPPVPGKQWS